MSDIIKQLSDAEAERKKLVEAAEATYVKKTKVFRKDAKKEFTKLLKASRTMFDFLAVSDSATATLLGQVIKTFDIKWQTKSSKTPKARESRKPVVQDEEILEFLAAGEKPQKEIQKHFKWSAVTVIDRLDKLREQKKIEFRVEKKQGRPKHWKKI